MSYRLRYQAHDLELPIGEFAIGRSTDCQLSLDDPLVSRRHALMRVYPNRVTVQDLGSRNGVLVNAVRIDGERILAPGDKVTIGGQDMVLEHSDDAAPPTRDEEHYRRATQTLGAASVAAFAMSDPPTTEISRSLQSFRLLGGVAEKALALGRAEEAERILQALLLDTLTRARQGTAVEADVMESATRHACKLASATGKGSWVDYVFDLYRATTKLMPGTVVDELYTIVRKVKAVDLSKVRSYQATLKDLAPGFGPTERFVVQRIEGLERLVAAK